MLSYARSDTHYLLDIYDMLLRDLCEAAPPTDSDPASLTTSGKSKVIEVLERGKDICLRKYDRCAFYPNGWKSLLRNSSAFSPQKKRCLARLWDWRDSTSRELDESLVYVCPSEALVRICRSMPTSRATLLNVLSPAPVVVAKRAEEILGIVREAKLESSGEPNRAEITTSKESISELRASASPFSFKPAGCASYSLESSPGIARGRLDKASDSEKNMMSPSPMLAGNVPGRLSGISPVMGTDALYKHAGWLAPHSSHEEEEKGNNGVDLDAPSSSPTGKVQVMSETGGEGDDENSESNRLIPLPARLPLPSSPLTSTRSNLLTALALFYCRERLRGENGGGVRDVMERVRKCKFSCAARNAEGKEAGDEARASAAQREIRSLEEKLKDREGGGIPHDFEGIYARANRNRRRVRGREEDDGRQEVKGDGGRGEYEDACGAIERDGWGRKKVKGEEVAEVCRDVGWA